MANGIYGRLMFGTWLGMALALGGSRPATAGLMGSTVNVLAYYPTSTDVLANPGDEVVTPDVEYPVGTFSRYNLGWLVDVTDDQFVLSTVSALSFPFVTGDFNGFILKVISGPAIVSASASGTSDFSPVSITVLDGNEIQLNYSGVALPAGPHAAYTSIINFTFESNAVPEPSSLISGGIACALGLAGVRRRRAKAGA